MTRQRFGGLASWLAGVVALLAAFSAASAAEARWYRAETPHFVLYSDGDEDALRDYANRLERFDQLLRGIHGMPLTGGVDRRLPIYLVQGRSQLEVVWPEAGEGIQGFYTATPEDTFAVAIRARRENDVLQHEYVHHFMLQNFAGASYPAWVVEGYAEYFMGATEQGRDLVFGQPNRRRGELLTYVNWIPLSDVISRRPSEFSSTLAASQYYGQAWLLTHWFMADAARRARFFTYLREVGQGEAPESALVTAAGMPIAQLERTLQEYNGAPLRYSNIPLSNFSTTTATITALPTSADDLLLLNQRLKTASGADDALLARVRQAAARYPDDPFAQTVLGRAELVLGSAQTAMGILDRVVAASPEHAEALRLAGAARISLARAATGPVAAGLRRDAFALLQRAIAADDSTYQSLLLAEQMREGASGYPSSNDIANWQLALRNAPQVSTVRVHAANALMRIRQYRAAAILLGPVVNDPHHPADASSREMLARLRASTDGGPLAAAPAG